MKILHTADWHIGRTLYGRKRYEEFRAFLDWLLETIDQEQIDLLLISGDVFDTGTPSNRAQQLYYQFLCKVATSCCQHVVVTGGNHDSPSFLDAPGELLHALDIHVIGAVNDSIEREVITLDCRSRNVDDNGECVNKTVIVCAVPYLRDRDIRTAEAGETIDAKNSKLVAGVQQHYAEVVACAEKTRGQLYDAHAEDSKKIPIIAMGHLFTAGGTTLADDGVRELYVGSLAHVEADIFPAAIDYLALGHLHVAQKVGGSDLRRYSGSPIPMGFGEARHEKSVVILRVDESSLEGDRSHFDVRLKVIPTFQPLSRISGSLVEIRAEISNLKEQGSRAWLEIIFTGKELITELRQVIDDAVAESDLEVLRIKNNQAMVSGIYSSQEQETLDDINHIDVFKRCLVASDIAAEEHDELIYSYEQVVKELLEEDLRVD